MNAEERRFEAVIELIGDVAAHSRRGVPVIVEGPNDVKTLRKLGITGPIFCAKSRRLGLVDFLDSIATYSEVIILTDFDKEGRALAWRLRRDLSQMRVKVNVEIWKQLKALARSEMVGIENLGKYLDRLAASLLAHRKAS
ncbi:toprim domain-containing protein [archaeon]|nr:MAG: toprim domain-containing protein [archaeon]